MMQMQEWETTEDRAVAALRDAANRTDAELNEAMQALVNPYLQLMLRLGTEMAETLQHVQQRVGVTPREWDRLMRRAHCGAYDNRWGRIAKRLAGRRHE